MTENAGSEATPPAGGGEQVSGSIRRAVIRRIAERKRVSLSVAAHIYACKSIKAKQALCKDEQQRKAPTQ